MIDHIYLTIRDLNKTIADQAVEIECIKESVNWLEIERVDDKKEIKRLKQQLTEANETVDRLKIIIMSEEVKRLAAF